MNPLPAPITEAELDELEQFLYSDAVSSETLTLSELDGFLTALAVGPEVVSPDEWLPWIWYNEEPVFANPKERERIIGLIFALHARIIENLKEDVVEPIFTTQSLDDGSELTIPDEWCFGFLEGIRLRGQSWLPLLESEDAQLLALIVDIATGGRNQPEFAKIQSSPEEYDFFLDLISYAPLDIRDYWAERRKPSVNNMPH